MIAAGFLVVAAGFAVIAIIRTLQTFTHRLPWTSYIDQIVSSGAAAAFTSLMAWCVG